MYPEEFLFFLGLLLVLYSFSVFLGVREEGC